MTRPLDGVTVVSIEQAVAAPFATRQLADLGARVIKIERPDEGDFARHYDTTVRGQSSYFVWLNRSKESLALNLKHPDAATIVARLLDRADVFVQNLAPGASDRLGTAPADAITRHPRLIVCTISGYGSNGPYATKKAYDLLVQNEVGLLSVTGTPETPVKAGISIADIAAGMYAYSGVLTALYARTTTGRGTIVDVSLFDALGEWMSAPVYYTAYGGTAPPRTGANHATIAPYGPVRTGDGREITIGIQNAREWTRFCAEVLDDPALATDPRFASNSARVAHRDALSDIITRVFADRSTDDVVGRLEAAGIAYGRLNSVADFVGHPQLASRDRWRDIATPNGSVRALVPPVRMSGVDPVMGDVPSLGSHTDAILGELGFDTATVARWREEQMIR